MKKKTLFFVGVNILILLINRFQWIWYRHSIYLLGYFVYTIILVLYFLSIVLSIQLCKKIKKFRNQIFLIITTITIILYTTVLPFASVFSVLEFKFNYNERAKFIYSMHKYDMIQIDENDYQLPLRLFYLSKDGIVKIDNSYVLFQTHRFGNRSMNVLYCKKNNFCTSFFSYNRTDIIKQTNIIGNWYIVMLNES